MAVGARVMTVPATRPACMLVHAICAECHPTYVLLHGRRVAAWLTEHPGWLV